MVYGLRLRVYDLGFMVLGLWVRVWGFGLVFRV